MKIIFWDIDGVMNTPNEWGSFWTSRSDALNRELVQRAKQVTRETGAKAVLSSTWRVGRNGYKLTLKALREAGWEDVEKDFIGMTPILHTYRGKEIQAWLDTFGYGKVTKFVIVDDNDDMLELRANLVRTTELRGVSESDVEDIKERLK